MPTVVIRHPDGSEQEQSLGPELVVGRGPDCGLVLLGSGVSRKHARLFSQTGGVWVEDLGSSNGTYLNGQPVAKPTRLPPNGRVRVGEYELCVKGAPGAGPRVAAPPEPPALEGALSDAELEDLPPPRASMARPAPRPSALARPPPREALAVRPKLRGGDMASRWVLKGLSGLWVGQSWPVSGRMLVGRVPPAAILVDDSSVSRRHAELELSARGVVVRDLQSANGTRVNGEPLATERLLKSGDVIEFGVVEFSLEMMDSAGALALADPAELSLRGIPSRRAAKDSAAAARRNRLMLVSVALSMVALVIVLKKVIEPSGSTTPTPPKPPSAAAQLEERLAECRTYAEAAPGSEPDWEKAKVACHKALTLDAMNPSAVQLMKRVDFEGGAHAHFAQAERFLQLFQPEKALEEYGQIPEKSIYYFKAKPHAQEALGRAKTKSRDDCKRYLNDNLAKFALPKCEQYMKYACQNMSPEELRPRLGQRVNLTGGRLGRRDWRPKDPIYLEFLRTRAKLAPSAPPWECPRIAMFGNPTGEPPSPDPAVRRAIDARFPDKELREALMSYWYGRGQEAITTLERFRRDMRNVQRHQLSDDLEQKIEVAQNLFQNGESELHGDHPEKAAEAFDEVLRQDGLLMMGEAEKYPSFFRRNIEEDMAKVALRVGQTKWDHQDPPGACDAYRLGRRYAGKDLDLLNAIQGCTTLAETKLGEARSCEDLAVIARLAMDGDGIKEKVAERRSQLKCP